MQILLCEHFVHHRLEMQSVCISCYEPWGGLIEFEISLENLRFLLEFNPHWYDNLAGTRSACLGYIPFYYLYSYLLCYDLSSTSTSLRFDPYTLY